MAKNNVLGFLCLDKNTKTYSITPNQMAAVIIILGLIVRVLALLTYGNAFSQSSDDENYIVGTLNTMRTGQLTYGFWGSEPAMLIMPAFQLLLAILFQIFGYTQSDMITVRFILSAIGCLGILGLYKLAYRLFNASVGLTAAAMWAFWAPSILADNVIMTETLFVTCLLWFAYFAIKYCDTKKDSDFLFVLLFWFIGFMTRSTIALIPLLFIPYLISKRFPIKLLFKRGIAAVIILVFLCFPWWLRNYQVTGRFVSSTASAGSVLVIGTFYGNYPKTEVGLNTQTEFWIPGELNSLYNRMRREEEYAIRRIRYWWQHGGRRSFIEAYFLIKPRYALETAHYPWEIFEIPRDIVHRIHRTILYLALAGTLGLLSKQARAPVVLCAMIFGYGLVLAAIFVPFPRYMYPFTPFAFILAAYLMSVAGAAAHKCLLSLAPAIRRHMKDKADVSG